MATLKIEPTLRRLKIQGLKLKDKNHKRKERGSMAAEVTTKPSSNERVNESPEKKKVSRFLVQVKN